MLDDDAGQEGFMKGFLARKKDFEDGYIREYCVLSYATQSMKFYDE